MEPAPASLEPPVIYYSMNHKDLPELMLVERTREVHMKDITSSLDNLKMGTIYIWDRRKPFEYGPRPFTSLEDFPKDLILDAITKRNPEKFIKVALQRRQHIIEWDNGYVDRKAELFQDFENARYDMHKRLSKDFKAALTDPEKTLISRDYHTNYVLKH